MILIGADVLGRAPAPLRHAPRFDIKNGSLWGGQNLPESTLCDRRRIPHRSELHPPGRCVRIAPTHPPRLCSPRCHAHLAGFFCVRFSQGAWIVRYTKQALTYEHQLQQLQARGLRIDDAVQAEKYLRRVGYYRLMGYLFPLRIPGADNYYAGASMETALAHYEFDRTLRQLMGEAIAHIEVAVRTAVTYQLAHAYGSFGHLDPANFKQDGGQGGGSGQPWHTEWLRTLDGEVYRAREIFIEHYKAKYSEPLFPRVPIYMASELMSLGSLSKLVKAMHSADQAAVADTFEKPGHVLSSWLHSLSVTRNIAAHHGRMWNRKLGVGPAVPRHGQWQRASREMSPRKMFFTLCVVADLLKYTAAEPGDWVNRVSDHVEPFLADRRNLTGMGAPQGWRQHPLWTA